MSKVKLTPKKTSWRIIEKEIDGSLVSFFTIGALAKALDRAVSTLRVWEREGLLPETPHRTENGQRLYTIDQLQELKMRSRRDPVFSELVRRKRRTNKVVKKVKWASGEVEQLELYRVRVLAELIGRSAQTVRLMERKNGLPPTPLRSGNQRLYTMKMIEAVKRACLDKKYMSRWSEIYLEVLRNWQQLGVLGAEVLEDMRQ